MRTSLFAILVLVSGTLFAGETFLVEAKQVDYIDIYDDVCPPDELCDVHWWFRYQIDGLSIETGKEIYLTIAGQSHAWYGVDAPWLVTIEPTKGKEEYDFLGVEYVIAEIEVFDHFICLEESRQFADAAEDVVYQDKLNEDEDSKKCYSYDSIHESLPGR